MAHLELKLHAFQCQSHHPKKLVQSGAKEGTEWLTVYGSDRACGSEAVKGKRDHGHGPPHLHIAAAVFETVKDYGMEGQEIAHKAREVAWAAVVDHFTGHDMEVGATWVKSLRVSDLYHKPNTVPKARITFKLEGTVTIPTDPSAVGDKKLLWFGE